MKLTHLLLALALLIGGWFAWKRLPGIRTQVETTVEEYGGWTSAAREADPVGFLTFAQERFREDLVQFAASRTDLMAAGERAQEEVERHTALIAAADDLAGQFRAHFKGVEASDSWPTQFRGGDYDRESFVEQVEAILAEKRNSQQVLTTYEEVVVTAADREADLRDRITSTRATLQQLAAQKELVRVDKMTAEADDLLNEIEELLGGNKAIIEEDAGPVRSLEELLSASSSEPIESDADQDALNFLQAN